MGNDFSERMIKVGLNVAIIATALNIICDLLLFSGPSGGADVNNYGFLLPALGAAAPLRTAVGAGLGVLFVATWVFALPALSRLLVNVNPSLKYATLACFVLFTGASSAFHGSYALLAGAGRLITANGLDAVEASVVIEGASQALTVPTLLALFGYSVLFVLSVLSGKSRLPKWTALCPLVVFASVPPALASLVPAPVGGAVAISASTAGITLYFVMVRSWFVRYATNS